MGRNHKGGEPPFTDADARAVVGILCEYDPFHRGHARQFSLIRETLPGARIICLMSGPFTQRGMPALYSPAFRAQAALLAGADLVLELPGFFAVREAENFALGGISILNGLGIVTHLSFGCEHMVLPLLQEAAALLEDPDECYESMLREGLRKGACFATAQGRALEQALRLRQPAYLRSLERDTGGLPGILTAPNNVLAVCYLRALRRLGSSISPLPVLREGKHHETSLKMGGYPSGTAVRNAILAQAWHQAEAAAGYPLPKGPLCRPVSMDRTLLFLLRRMSREQLAALPGCAEGLENRLFAACRQATDRAGLLTALKTKRYSYARLNRLCCCALLGITAALQREARPLDYVRMLGFQKSSESLLSFFPKSAVPLVAKAADGPLDNPSYQTDIRAYDAWALGAGEPAGWMFRQPVQVVQGHRQHRAKTSPAPTDAR
ncbi:MAG: nucleotidyltransferase family protein [Clostridia bacterium]|nr:nucleotidyltransferase family protein [Clostridia bacterium]